MTTPLTEDELDLLRRIAAVQETDLVDLCIELDIVPDEPFRVDDVVEPVMAALIDRVPREGLPVSKYDADDLTRFSAKQLTSFARALGVRVGIGASADAVIAAIVKAMRKVPKKLPRNSQLPLMLTYFLPALIRHFDR